MSKKYIAVLNTDDYRGDHSSDVKYMYDVTPETTIADIASKIERDQDYIEIRRVLEINDKIKDGE